MTKYSFRIALIIYSMIHILGQIGYRFAASEIPPEVYKAQWELLGAYPSFSTWLVSVIVLILNLVGVVGMFFFWSRARLLFLVSVAAQLILIPFFLPSWSAINWYQSLYHQSMFLMNGIIIGILFIPSARPLFVNTYE